MTYSDREIHDLITESLYETEFVGVKGYVKFDESGDSSGLISIRQQQGKVSSTNILSSHRESSVSNPSLSLSLFITLPHHLPRL